MPTTRMSDHYRLPEENEAHVWTAFQADFTPELPSLEGLLSVEEAKSAARFLRSDDRTRYIVAHGILRQLLGRYLTVSTDGLEFITGDFGKPALNRQGGLPPISFNLSHSGDVILYVVANNRRVGVDVEAVRGDVDIMELAEGQFSPQEFEALRAIGPSEQTEAFFRCWARKEAYVKARGEGLGFPLKQFSVSFGRDDPPGVLWAADDPSAPERWAMFDLAPAPGYAGAVVVEGRPINLTTRRWT